MRLLFDLDDSETWFIKLFTQWCIPWDTDGTPTGHQRDTDMTPPGHQRDPTGNRRDTDRTSTGHRWDTNGTPTGQQEDTDATQRETDRTPARHRWDTDKTSTEHRRDTYPPILQGTRLVASVHKSERMHESERNTRRILTSISFSRHTQWWQNSKQTLITQ